LLLSDLLYKRLVVLAVLAMVAATSASCNADPYGRGIIGGIRVACIRANSGGVRDGGIAPYNDRDHDLCGFLTVVQNIADVPRDGARLPHWRRGEMAWAL
jgi:hypothetical protein